MPELGMGHCHWGTKYGVILTLSSNFTPHIQKARSQGNILPGDRFPYSLGKTEQTRERAARVSHLGTTQGTVRHPLKPPKVKETIRYCSKRSDMKKRGKSKQTNKKNESRGKEKSSQGTEEKKELFKFYFETRIYFVFTKLNIIFYKIMLLEIKNIISKTKN